jgi:DNA polymerase III delta subunit
VAKEADPREEWRAHEQALAPGAPLAPAYVLRGAERWYRDRAVELVVARAKEAGLEICRHDAKEGSKSGEFRLEALLDDLTGIAMFAGARCVVVLEPEALLKKTESGAESAFGRAARSFVQGKRGTLVLSAESLRVDLAIVKELIESGARARTFRKLYERPSPWERDPDPRRTELVGWLAQRAKERGVALTPDQAVLLTHSQGNDLSALDDVLSGIASGAAKDVLARLTSAAAGSPNEVADGLIAGDVRRAVLAIETLFRGGMRKQTDGTRETDDAALVAILLGTLRNKVRAGVAAAGAIERGASAAEATALAGVTGFDRVLRDAIEQRRTSEWRAMLDDLLEVERRARRAPGVDAADFTRLALRWSRKRAMRAAR